MCHLISFSSPFVLVLTFSFILLLSFACQSRVSAYISYAGQYVLYVNARGGSSSLRLLDSSCVTAQAVLLLDRVPRGLSKSSEIFWPRCSGQGRLVTETWVILSRHRFRSPLENQKIQSQPNILFFSDPFQLVGPASKLETELRRPSRDISKAKVKKCRCSLRAVGTFRLRKPPVSYSPFVPYSQSRRRSVSSVTLTQMGQDNTDIDVYICMRRFLSFRKT